MSTSPSRLAARLRQPEYTGENRCLPCTVLNTGIGVALAAVATLVATPPVGATVLAVSLAAIYLRGYLVPGTPELTKRYLPDRLLRRFGKAPALPEPGETVDVEAYLLDAGALDTEVGDDADDTDLADGGDADADDDLVLTPGFRDEWERRIEEADSDVAEAAGALLDLSDPDVEERGEAYVVTDGGMRAADWPSRAALLADLGAVPALRARDPDWAERSMGEQGRILAGLRVFLGSCPACGGEPVLGEETVESCCREAAVYTYSCPDCDARLLELEQ